MTSALLQTLVLVLVVGITLALVWRWAHGVSAQHVEEAGQSPATAVADEPVIDQGRVLTKEQTSPTLSVDDPIALQVTQAIQSGDLQNLQRLLEANPGLAQARLATRNSGTRTLLHVATDWPGHFPNGATTILALIAAGADVNARATGPHEETPLHWAASSNDMEVLDALLDAGADAEAPGSVVDGGPPLADAVAFGQWHVAHRLVERGALTTLWQAAALGMLERVTEICTAHGPLKPDEITNAFWFACHGGQQDTAAYLLERGANLNWVGHQGLTPLDAARRSNAEELVEWLRGRGATSTAERGENDS